MSEAGTAAGLGAWLRAAGLAECEAMLAEADVDLDVMAELTDEDLREIGLSLGQRKRLLRAIAERGADAAPAARTRAERRHVTAVFSDLVGSTRLATRHDAEDLARILQLYHAACDRVLRRWGGSMQGIYGDGCAMVFGHPVGHEDDAERAVRAALEMVEAVSALGPFDGERLSTRVAVATGRAVVGDMIGASGPGTVSGDVMNLASRLQDVAEPDTVVVSASTRRLVASRFELEARGAHVLRGFPQPMAAWTVRAVHETADRHAGRLEAAAGRPMLGRADDLAALRSVWHGVRDGRGGRTLLIGGEPGIGKSRLVADFTAEAAPEAARAFRFFCAAWHDNSALHPFLTQIAWEAGALRGQGRAEMRPRLVAWCAENAPGDPEAAADLLCAQLAPDPDAPLTLNAAQQKAAMFELIEGALLRAAADGPVLVVVEDAHWADPTSLELIGRLVDGPAMQAPVLLIVTHRPDFAAPWPEAPAIGRLRLDRLGAAGCAALARAVAGETALPEARLRDIVAKADGVPLFVEELVRAEMELDRAAVGDALPVPETLEDSLMARLDRLGPAKGVAQLAATIGRRFTERVLAEVSGERPEALGRALDQLRAADIITPAADAPTRAWVFRHALIQDAAYASLLRSERQALHARIAGIIAAAPGGVGAAEPETLARHYAGADMKPEAVAQLIEAGRRATARAAQIEANNHYKAALALLAQMPRGPLRLELEATANAMLGASLLATMGFSAPEVGDAFQRSRELCEEAGDSPLHCAALYGVWIVSTSRSERERARALADELLELFGDSPVPVFALAAHFADGVTSFYLSDLDRAEAAFERAVALYDPELFPALMQSYGEDLGSYAIIYLQWVKTLRGDFGAAIALSEKVTRMANQLGDRHGAIRNVGFAMGGLHAMGAASATRSRAEALAAEAAEQCYPYWMAVARIGRGWAMARLGEAEAGVAEIEPGLAFLDLIGQRTPRTYWRAYLAEALILAGRRAEAEALLDETLAEAAVHLDRFYAPELRRLRAEARAEADPAAAEAEFRAAVADAEAEGAHYLALRAATGLARLLAGTQAEAEALATLRAARGRVSSPETFPVLAEADAMLAG